MQITTGQAVGAGVWLVAQTVLLLGVIRHLYEQRVTDCIRTYEARLLDRDATLRLLQARVERMEAAEERQVAARERTVTTLEDAVAALKKQTDLQEVIAERLPRRRAAS